MQLWKDLLSNLAIVAIVVQIWCVSRSFVPKISLRGNQLLFGLLFGSGAVAVMHIPFNIGDGIFIDLRSVFIGLAAYFGGPVTGVMAASMAIAQRASMGGAGTLFGIFAICASLSLGLAAKAVARRYHLHISGLVGLSLTIAMVTQIILYAIPGDAGRVAFRTAFPALPLILFVSLLMSGLAMAHELRWRRAQTLNMTYRAVISALPDCLNVKDLTGRFLLANPATARLMEAENDQALIGKTDFDFYPHEVAAKFADDEKALRAAGETMLFEQTYIRPDNTPGYLQTLKSPFRDEDGNLIGIITHNRDVTEKVKLKAAYRKAKDSLALAMENMADGLVSFGADGSIQFCNTNYRRLFPLTADVREPGSHYQDIVLQSLERGERAPVPGFTLRDYLSQFESTLKTEDQPQFELADGRWIEAHSRPQTDGSCLLTYREITNIKKAEAELRALNNRLEHLAATDGLTGLRNRRAFDIAIEEATHAGRRQTLLLADIDHFKAYNDLYGHPAGDEVIKAVAGCLDKAVSKVGGFSARYGGEELAAILSSCDLESAFDIAVEFRLAVEALAITHAHSSHGVVSVSVGISSLPGTLPASVGDILQAADKALYRAKETGRNVVRVG